MREQIRSEIESIRPLDSIEDETISKVIAWIDSGAELCRIEKPATPNKHLVSYFVVIDGEYLLLVDHINAEKWLPTGGHVEKGEHPRNTVEREVYEELKINAEFLYEKPLLLTSTETVGKTAGHTDISIWYALKGDRASSLTIDKSEFHEARWFHRSQIPANTDPHLMRFVEKFYGEST
ncbi:MAG: NUDIX hydrolase [Pseudomonadales bacterium]|nr:NUDIX hydrolase [Pseudomonadales bacterium]